MIEEFSFREGGTYLSLKKGFCDYKYCQIHDGYMVPVVHMIYGLPVILCFGTAVHVRNIMQLSRDKVICYWLSPKLRLRWSCFQGRRYE